MSRPRVWRKLAPLDFVRIFLVDFALPALLRNNVRDTVGSALLRAVHVNNRVLRQSARMAKYRRSRHWRSLAPCIFEGIVDLHIVYWPILRATTYQINVAVTHHANHRAIHRYWDVFCTIPTAVLRYIPVHIGHCELVALIIDNISAKKKNLTANSCGD